jgi:hypothetical protein
MPGAPSLVMLSTALVLLFEARQELHEQVGIGPRAPVLGIASVQVDDRGAGFSRGHRFRDDLVGLIGRATSTGCGAIR